MIGVGLTLLLGWSAFQAGSILATKVEHKAATSVLHAACKSCRSEMSPAGLARLQSLPDLTTPHGRFLKQVQEGRAALIAIGRNPNDLIATPDVQVTLALPGGLNRRWVFDSNGYISDFFEGNAHVQMTHFQNGIVQTGAYFNPAVGYNSLTPILLVHEDTVGAVVDFVDLTTNTTYQVGISPPASATPFMTTVQTAAQKRHLCQIRQDECGRKARQAYEDCCSNAWANIGGRQLPVLGIALAGAAIGFTAGGPIGGLVGLAVGVTLGEAAVIIALLFELNACNQILNHALDTCHFDYRSCLKKIYPTKQLTFTW